MKKEVKKQENLKDIEQVLRNGKLPDTDPSSLRQRVWQGVLSKQRGRRKPKAFLRLLPWTWALASIIVILLGILVIFLLK